MICVIYSSHANIDISLCLCQNCISFHMSNNYLRNVNVSGVTINISEVRLSWLELYYNWARFDISKAKSSYKLHRIDRQCGYPKWGSHAVSKSRYWVLWWSYRSEIWQASRQGCHQLTYQRLGTSGSATPSSLIIRRVFGYDLLFMLDTQMNFIEFWLHQNL